MNDTLLIENQAKEREIRRMNKDIHLYEQKLLDLRKEISNSKSASQCAKRDAEVSAGICCSDRIEPGSGERLSVALRDEASKCQEKVRSMEDKLKSAAAGVGALRKANVALSGELFALRRVYVALEEQCRAASVRAQIKDDIIREMRRQLKQAKAKVSCQALVASTPAHSACACRSDTDLSAIERDPSVQNTSADSVEDLERMLFRECCLTPSSMMACSRQTRMMSAAAGSYAPVPTVGVALSDAAHCCHEKDPYDRNTSLCDCANIAQAVGGTPSDRRSLAERLSVTAPPDINPKDDKESSESKSPKEQKTSKRSSLAGLFKKNKSTKTTESSDDHNSPDREPKKSKSKNDKKNKSRKNSNKSDIEEDDSPDKESKKSKSKKGNRMKSPKDSDTGDTREEDSPDRKSKETKNKKRKKSKSPKSSDTDESQEEAKKSKKSLAQEKQKSQDSESSLNSATSKKSKKSIWNRKKKEKDKKRESEDSDASADSGNSGTVDAGTGTAALSPVDVGAGPSPLESLDGFCCEKFRSISSCPYSPCDSPPYDLPCRSYPCSPRTPRPCPARTLPPCMVKPCPILSKDRYSSKSAIPTPCPRKDSPPCLAKTLLNPCEFSPSDSQSGSPCPSSSKNSDLIPCPGSTLSPSDPKPCPAKSLLKPCSRARSSSPFVGLRPCAPKPFPIKPCSRSHNSSPCRSPSPCDSKLSSGAPDVSTSPYDPKPCPTRSPFKPCTRSVTPPCGLSGFKLSSLLPCPFNMASPCAQKPTCEPKSPCDIKPPDASKPPCESNPCAPKPCPAKTRPCSPSHSPCDTEETFLNTTLTKLSTLLSGPCKTSTPCAPNPCLVKSSLKPCSRSQDNSPCRSPTLCEESSLNKTFPCTPKPCPAASTPCNRRAPCIRKTPCTSCRPKPCNEISPCHSSISSINSSCADVCATSKDPCEQQAPCDSTFNAFDFLKRCVQFLPGSEDMKPLCPQETCPRGEAVCPTIKEENDTSASCKPHTDKAVLTQEESCEMAGMCDSARAQYYRNKLISTQQILENKEETIRIQGESLAVAESRLATLTIRATQLRQELECKSCELRMLRRAMPGCSCEAAQRADASTAADAPCADQKHKNMVKTLETNLSIIEDLYRECFYESAKQEALIEKLRQSYLDVRLSDKERTDEIGRLQNVVNTQKWSLDQCQDIAMEVEGLKMEISNFLNSSNNDSGMWERSEDSTAPAPDVSEDLQQIAEQLQQLKHLLHQEDPVIAELTNENCRLKCENNELKEKVCTLECTRQNNEEVIVSLEKEKECTENKLRCAQTQVQELTERVGQLQCAAGCAQEEFSELQCLYNATNQKLEKALEQICHHECTETSLRAQLEEAKQLAEENERMCGELCALQQSVRDWSAELRRAQQRVAAYRQQAARSAELQQQLQEAQAQGAALCEDSRAVVGAVRRWLRGYREQDEKIRRQQTIIWTLNKELEEKQCRCSPPAAPVGCSKCGAGAGAGAGARRRCGLATCPALHARSHTAVCDLPAPAAAPPRRPFKKKAQTCTERCVSRCRSASAQQPEGTREAAAGAPPPAPAPAPTPSCCASHRLRPAGCGPSAEPPCGQSPSQELLERVENLHHALAAGQRRWGRAPAKRS